jgi:ketosteroid isomerase-like protein
MNAMKKLLRPVVVGLALAVTSAAAEADDAAAIRAVLAAQAEAWNRGDIPGYMEGYWKSERLRFASDGNITHGWQPTLERYLKRYPDKAAMGALTFTELELTLLAPDAALVFGKWELTRARDKPWGLYTLLLRKIDGRWLVVSDHTSSAGP